MDVSRVSLPSLTSTTILDLPEFQIPPADPFSLAAEWISRAIDTGVREPGTIALATADGQGEPSSRFVLLKGFDDQGLIFVSQTSSRKGQDIAANPRASASFYWQELRLQLHLSGAAEKLSPAESDALFNDRPLASRAVSSVSVQGKELLDENVLTAQINDMISRGARLERPDRWVGYRIRPERFEFWQGGADRLHKRLEYTLFEENWSWRKLQP
ncbi:MAG: pyridoxamine 5'-phosphate oxidase [Thermoleophilaceae bacterium]|nr:pyridoxamine 5'-phosphate oxidase [Thermoleophilaceae bacterium]